MDNKPANQSLAQGVPVGVEPKKLLVNEMGDEDLGFEMKLGVEDLSILKIKNKHNHLSQQSSSEKAEGVAQYMPVTALAETKDQDDEISRL